jgi:carbon storage regulator
MLVLSRKLGERIMIGDRVAVTVVKLVKLGNGQVRLGIEAPRELAVFREEINPRLHAPILVQPIV